MTERFANAVDACDITTYESIRLAGGEKFVVDWDALRTGATVPVYLNGKEVGTASNYRKESPSETSPWSAALRKEGQP